MIRECVLVLMITIRSFLFGFYDMAQTMSQFTMAKRANAVLHLLDTMLKMLTTQAQYKKLSNVPKVNTKMLAAHQLACNALMVHLFLLLSWLIVMIMYIQREMK